MDKLAEPRKDFTESLPDLVNDLRINFLAIERWANSLQPSGSSSASSCVIQSVLQTLTTATLTTVTFDTIRYDNLHTWQTGTNQFQISSPGVYLVTACVRFAANATGVREIVLLRTLFGFTSTYELADDTRPANASGTTTCSVSTTRALAAGDMVYVQVLQSSGGNLNTDVSGTDISNFTLTRLGSS